MKNYKKILALVLLSLVLISSLTLISFAEDEVATVNEKFTTITYNGEKYMALQETMAWKLNLEFEDVEYSEIELSFSESQEKIIYDYSSTEYYNKDGKLSVLEITYTFENSDSILTVTYLDDATFEDFTDLYDNIIKCDDVYIELINNTSIYSIETVDANYSVLKSGTPYSMTPFNLNNYNFLYVYRLDPDHEVSVCCGILVFEYSNEKYYYLDYAENKMKPDEYPDTLFPSGFIVRELSDESLIAALNEELGIQTGDDDLDFTTDFGDGFAVVMVILAAIVFGVAPLVVAIICFIKAPKMESPYCGLMRAIAIICSVITFFVALVLIFFLL